MTYDFPVLICRYAMWQGRMVRRAGQQDGVQADMVQTHLLRIAPMSLEFDADTHEYKLNGRIVPSVTTIINAIMPGWQSDAWYLGRGRAVHHGCRLLDEGKLDWASVAPAIEPRIRAWEKFRKDYPVQVMASELPLASERHQYAGTVDCVFMAEPGSIIVGDIKSTIEPQVVIQLGGYSRLLAENKGFRIDKAVAVQLDDDGQYKCKWFDQRALRLAEQQFLAALTTFSFMAANGLIEKGKTCKSQSPSSD